MSRTLVSGGFGYLGGRIAAALAARGDEVLLGSRTERAAPSWLPSARTARMDWKSDDGLERIVRGCDSVIHLAGTNARDSAADPAGALEFNGAATARLVAAAARAKVRRFIYFSTAHVYASPLVGRLTESSPTTNAHPYATTHLAGENAVRAAARTCDGYFVIRLSNAFGPPMHADADCWTLLINDLARQAVTTGAMTLRTPGTDRRDFIPIADVSRAVVHLLEHGPAGGGTFNLGGSWSPTVWEVASLVRDRSEAILGRPTTLTRPEPGPRDIGADLDFRSDALAATGFRPAGDRVAEIDALLRFCAEAFA